jgi:hypothetical protein
MRWAAFRLATLFLILTLCTIAAYPQQPGLTAGSWEETTSADLDGDGIPQNLELQLARHFFPTIWYDSGEDTSSPGGNHNHRVNNQPGRLLFRVRPHPQSPAHIAISYALLYRVDGGEGFGATWACHMGDVEPFAITLKPDSSCALGYGMQSIKTWAHEGTSGEHAMTRYASGCNWGFSVSAVSFTDTVFASENKHGNYLTDSACDGGLGGLENCDTDWTAADVNAWIGLNVGEPDPVSARRHADLSPLGFNNLLWANQSFCGGPHSSADYGELDDCFPQGSCPSAAETKFTDKFVAPFIPLPPPSGMQANSAVRGCSDWWWWSPVYQPDPGSCYTYCAQNGASACEWNENGDCYVEFSSGGCSVQSGFPGWWAAVF